MVLFCIFLTQRASSTRIRLASSVMSTQRLRALATAIFLMRRVTLSILLRMSLISSITSHQRSQLVTMAFFMSLASERATMTRSRLFSAMSSSHASHAAACRR